MSYPTPPLNTHSASPPAPRADQDPPVPLRERVRKLQDKLQRDTHDESGAQAGPHAVALPWPRLVSAQLARASAQAGAPAVRPLGDRQPSATPALPARTVPGTGVIAQAHGPAAAPIRKSAATESVRALGAAPLPDPAGTAARVTTASPEAMRTATGVTTPQAEADRQAPSAMAASQRDASASAPLPDPAGTAARVTTASPEALRTATGVTTPQAHDAADSVAMAVAPAERNDRSLVKGARALPLQVPLPQGQGTSTSKVASLQPPPRVPSAMVEQAQPHDASTRITVPFASYGPGHHVTASWGGQLPGLRVRSSSERSHSAVVAALDAGMLPGRDHARIDALHDSGDEHRHRQPARPSGEEDQA